MVHFGDEIAGVLRRLPADGSLFPYLQTVRCGDRATEFHQRCVGLGIKGVSLHSYRYAWAYITLICGANSPVVALVSVGQTGADRAALDWAIENGIPHGGWCPRRVGIPPAILGVATNGAAVV